MQYRNNCLKEKTFLYPNFYPFHLTQPSSSYQIKTFTWCLEGSAPPIKSYPPICGLPNLSQPICSSKSHKYDNYDKPSHKVSSQPQLPSRQTSSPGYSLPHGQRWTTINGQTHQPDVNQYLLDPKVIGSLATRLVPKTQPSTQQDSNRNPSNSECSALTHVCKSLAHMAHWLYMRHSVQKMFFKFNPLFVVFTFQMIY